MSNNLVSQFPTSDGHMVQMENVSSSMNFPVSEMQMRMMSHVSNDSESRHFPVSKEPMGFAEPMTGSLLNTSMVPKIGVGHTESLKSGIESSSTWMSNQMNRESGVMNNMVGENTSLSVKRKAEVGSLSNSSTSQQLVPNKRQAHLGADVSSPRFLPSSALQRRTGAGQSGPSSQGLHAQSSTNKKMARNEPISGKAGLQRGQPVKKQTTLLESASKARPESSEAVRSKMRESLAAALALAFEKSDNVSNTKKDENDATAAHQTPRASQASESKSTMGGHASDFGSGEVFTSKESALVGMHKDSQVLSVELPPNESSRDAGLSFQEFQYSSILLDEDAAFSDNFFIKDDLLQGNGLSWAFDFDVQMREGKEAQDVEKAQCENKETQGHTERGEVLTPENLAFKIEGELFKLYSGVNKKYKEKGRSLLFNLKDRNNPELRERVMSGEISPEKLCSMSAEELASKELSEWRMAKAEELAQMVVLPDTEVDVRRLVKKTHKGEYQVEYEHDDGIIAEVSGGTSILTQHQPKKDIETRSPSDASLKDKKIVGGLENNIENQDFPGSLVIPTDGTDLMQGMMVDEMKDAKFLPPIVSLDEFMESLNSEPPFETLSADAAQNSPMSHEERPKAVISSRTADRAAQSPRDDSSKKADAKKHEVNVNMRSSWSPVKQKALPSVAPKVEYIWDGVLQLSLSSSVTVGGLFQSGEKTSTKEWPASLEIKGRVRLDAFEKFMQELPKSRTRAVMVLQIVLKDKSSENERSTFSEAVDSYISDERLGYAEPAPGVELYLCPPTPRISEMISKNTPQKTTETSNRIEDDLIGVVVWRRAHSSNITSPNSSSHHKHTSRKQPLTHHNRVQDSRKANFNNNTPTRTPLAPPYVLNNSKSKPEPEPEEDDDIPPGFGPGAAAAKDDDDLPEFNFSGNINPSPAPRISPQNLHHGVKASHTSVDQVRELIQKYGQSGNNVTSRSWVDDRGLGIEPWNDDDDDDIPEWQPHIAQPLHHQYPQPHPVLHGHQPQAHIPPSSRPVAPVVAQQTPRGLAPQPTRGRWAHPPGPPRGGRWRQH